MNIYALEGHKVIVTEDSVKHGDEGDKETIKKLEIGKVYEVLRTDVHNWYTRVYLKGVEGSFNSVNFEDVEAQPPHRDRLHENWRRYN